ncbi:MAG TPA: HWE histidine kinase domain-containing protein [Novosphingobium sp.]
MSDVHHPLRVDLTSCDLEPIHIIGRIQSFGYLVSFSSDWIVNHASVNCSELFGRNVREIIGYPAYECLAEQALHDIRSRLQLLMNGESVERIFEINAIGDGRLFDVAAHRSGRSYVLEFEPSETGHRRDYAGYVRPMVDRMRKSDSVIELCEIAARQLRGLTGFDRVMVYRFAPDGAGEVIAENRGSRIDSFKGQHFPASDIPAQARALYARNMLRIIADVDDPTVPIVPTVNPRGEPLDLSMSGLRAVSPIHIEYLGNMGVKASMSVSIMRRGKLWGLMACHHYTPLRLSYSIRTAAELFGEFFSFLLDQSEVDQAIRRREKSLLVHDEIMARLAGGGSLLSAFEDFADSIAGVIPFDGIVGWVDGEFMSRGLTPTRDEFIGLARFLNTAGASTIWCTDHLASVHEPARAYVERCSGLLALPVSRAPRDYIVLCRKEFVHDIDWAGDPSKPMELGPNGDRLTPRKSFAIWKEERRARSRPWETDEIASAEALRITLLEVVLRLADAAHREREAAGQRQDTLIAELNHRIRNILNLIRSLVSQSHAGSDSIDQFAEIVGNRIHALARAHDQVTQTNWTPSSLRQLILTECRAYASDSENRISVTGSDALIRPRAFTSLALVFHELMTNSCKYGALCAPGGSVSIRLERRASGELDIHWLEAGGPTVAIPQRRGFGSTIIERTIPHELGGKAGVEFHPAGLRAHFVVPSQYIAYFEDIRLTQGEVDVISRGTEKRTMAALSGNALVVEDNMIIAMEAEDILREMGCDDCHVAGSVKNALAILADQEIAFALLDIDLGTETSEEIADALQSRGIPFVFASGYGEYPEFGDSFRTIPIVAKPYSRDDISAAIVRMGAN